MTATPTRSTAAVWRPGDPVGDRRFAAIGDLALERGGVLPDVTVAYETWGTLSPSGDNAVLVEHALTGDSARRRRRRAGARVARLVAGADRPRGAARHRPPLRRREQRARRVPGHDRAGIRRPGRASVGRPVPVRHHPRPGGGRGRARRRARHPAVARRARRVDGRDAGARVGGRTHPTASSAPWCSPRPPYATADQVAWCQPQLLAIRSDPAFRGGDYYDAEDWPVTGMGIARRIAHTTYRHEAELDDRFGRRPRGGRGPARRWRSLRRRELPRPPRDQARPALRPEQLRRAHRGDEQPRRRARSRRARRRPRRVPGSAARRRRHHRPALPAAAVRGDRGGPRGDRAVGHRVARTDTTGSSSRPSRWARSSPVR